ncbi:MAG TPA: PilZ domain-containing protein [Kofleriaceae bacterium]|nr:PilZ domain-containing protein [Kofleriaceae bacterium]
MTEQQKPQRRDKRYRTQLPVRTRIGGRLHALLTDDVSYRGLFLCTEKPPPVRQLIRIETILPPNNVPFATHGMVVYVIGMDDPNGRPPGCGVQFYGMGDERRLWEAFIQFTLRRADPVPDRRTGPIETIDTVGFPTPTLTPPAYSPAVVSPVVRPTAPPNGARASVPPPASSTGSALPFRVAIGSGAHENRRFHRFPIVLEVWPRNLDELIRMYSRDVSVGGMFLPTTREIPLSSELRLEIRHPHADSVFPMTAIVRRCSAQPPGIGIEFVGLDDRKRRQFFEFIHAPLPAAEADDIELYEGE